MSSLCFVQTFSRVSGFSQIFAKLETGLKKDSLGLGLKSGQTWHHKIIRTYPLRCHQANWGHRLLSVGKFHHNQTPLFWPRSNTHNAQSIFVFSFIVLNRPVNRTTLKASFQAIWLNTNRWSINWLIAIDLDPPSILSIFIQPDSMAVRNELKAHNDASFQTYDNNKTENFFFNCCIVGLCIIGSYGVCHFLRLHFWGTIEKSMPISQENSRIAHR